MKYLNLVITSILLGLIFLLTACNDLEELEPNLNEEFLIGKWQEKESEELIQFGGTNHCIEFTADDFQLKRSYWTDAIDLGNCLLYTSPSPRDATLSRMPSSA